MAFLMSTMVSYIFQGSIKKDFTLFVTVRVSHLGKAATMKTYECIKLLTFTIFLSLALICGIFSIQSITHLQSVQRKNICSKKMKRY